MIRRPRLLITRFAPHANILAKKLNDNGCFSIAQPLLVVEPLSDTFTLNLFLKGTYELVIAVSGNAVKYTHQQVGDYWPQAAYFAVGKSTQNKLYRVTQQAVSIPLSRFDSEGLLALPMLNSVKKKRILILRGEGGRELLEDTLRDRGAKVDFFQTYKRTNIDLDGRTLVNKWQQASINGAIISSVEILNQLFTLVPQQYKNWLFELTLYVPSQRIAEQASILGANKIVLLPSLHTDHIVNFFNNK